MKEIELKQGETIKVKGQKTVHMILVNINGEIYSRTDSQRDEDIEKSLQSNDGDRK